MNYAYVREALALETGPQSLTLIIEFHSICKFSHVFKAISLHPALCPGHGLFLCWMEKIFICWIIYFFVLYSVQTEGMGAFSWGTDKDQQGFKENESCRTINWLRLCSNFTVIQFSPFQPRVYCQLRRCRAATLTAGWGTRAENPAHLSHPLLLFLYFALRRTQPHCFLFCGLNSFPQPGDQISGQMTSNHTWVIKGEQLTAKSKLGKREFAEHG